MCIGFGNCLFLVWGLSSHVGVWAYCSGRPGAWVVAALVDAIALGLVVLRVCVHRAIPERAVWFHGPWTWSGFWDEVGEAAILGPVYVLLSVVAVIAVAVQGWRAGLRALRGTTPGA